MSMFDPSDHRGPDADVRHGLGDLAELAPAIPPGWRGDVRRRAQRQQRTQLAGAVLGTAVAGSAVGWGITGLRPAGAGAVEAGVAAQPSASPTCVVVLTPGPTAGSTPGETLVVLEPAPP
ncbi:MAG TPA: hypothetical protein VE781_01640, partial [Kineosporiaceae bacterium]|nr:hypothetical protein [Kineosporiaceae bacterium]